MTIEFAASNTMTLHFSYRRGTLGAQILAGTHLPPALIVACLNSASLRDERYSIQNAFRQLRSSSSFSKKHLSHQLRLGTVRVRPLAATIRFDVNCELE